MGHPHAGDLAGVTLWPVVCMIGGLIKWRGGPVINVWGCEVGDIASTSTYSSLLCSTSALDSSSITLTHLHRPQEGSRGLLSGVPH